MAASRAITIGGAYRWRFDRSSRAWQVIGKPKIRVTPTWVAGKRGGDVSLRWKLSTTRETYRDYHDAMLAAEGLEARHYRTAKAFASRRSRSR